MHNRLVHIAVLARIALYSSAVYATVRLPVRLSVTLVHCVKTAERTAVSKWTLTSFQKCPRGGCTHRLGGIGRFFSFSGGLSRVKYVKSITFVHNSSNSHRNRFRTVVGNVLCMWDWRPRVNAHVKIIKK